MSKRYRLKPKEVEALGLTPNLHNKYRLKGDKEKQLLELRSHSNYGIDEACVNTGVNKSNVPYLWIKTGNESVNVRNPNYIPTETKEVSDLLDGFIDRFKDLVSDIKPIKREFEDQEAFFDKLVFTDVHIGMNPNPDGYSMYGGKWDENELMLKYNELIQHVFKNKLSNVLYIDDLGDYLDGWDGKTVRREHDLPQNMDNQKAFDVAVKFKIKLIEDLIIHYNKIYLHNICEDNHAGAFGYVVNSAVKMYLEAKYPENVVVTNQRKFIDHYTVNNVTFITSHGKDSKNLKFGFKPVLDSIQIEKIHNYIFEHRLNLPNQIIEFCKGDSHQLKIDESSSDLFNYNNYMAFSPSSNWVQTNFKKGRSGFVFYNYYEDGSKSQHNHYFKWNN